MRTHLDFVYYINYLSVITTIKKSMLVISVRIPLVFDLFVINTSLMMMMMMMWSLVSSYAGLTYWGQTVTNACAWFIVALRPQKP